MLKRVPILILLFCIAIAQHCYAQTQLKYDRWPIDNFKKESVIKDYGNGHFGLDIQAPEGTPVYAPVAGKVYWTYSGGSHGISVGIEHKSGIRMTFLHLSERLVKKGQIVKSGQEIGKVGMTGSGRDSSPTHLHFAVILDSNTPITKPEIRYGNPFDFSPVTSVTKRSDIEESPLLEPLPKAEKPLVNNPSVTQTPLTQKAPEPKESFDKNREKQPDLKQSVTQSNLAANAPEPKTKPAQVKNLKTNKLADVLVSKVSNPAFRSVHVTSDKHKKVSFNTA